MGGRWRACPVDTAGLAWGGCGGLTQCRVVALGSFLGATGSWGPCPGVLVSEWQVASL